MSNLSINNSVTLPTANETTEAQAVTTGGQLSDQAIAEGYLQDLISIAGSNDLLAVESALFDQIKMGTDLGQSILSFLQSKMPGLTINGDEAHAGHLTAALAMVQGDIPLPADLPQMATASGATREHTAADPAEGHIVDENNDALPTNSELIFEEMLRTASEHNTDMAKMLENFKALLEQEENLH